MRIEFSLKIYYLKKIHQIGRKVLPKLKNFPDLSWHSNKKELLFYNGTMESKVYSFWISREIGVKNNTYGDFIV